jgi:hypothetical protein
MFTIWSRGKKSQQKSFRFSTCADGGFGGQLAKFETLDELQIISEILVSISTISSLLKS